MIRVFEDGQDQTLVVQGNCSASWRANLLLVASLGCVSLGLGGFAAFSGLWLVLPFVGLELVIVTAALYVTTRRLARREVITVGRDEVRLEWGHRAPEVSVSLPRHWAELHYKAPHNEFSVGELHLSAHGRRYRLGRELGRDEKQILYRRLTAVLGGQRDGAAAPA